MLAAMEQGIFLVTSPSPGDLRKDKIKDTTPSGTGK